MRGFVELTTADYEQRVLLPVGTFIAYRMTDGRALIRPCSCHCDSDCREMEWICQEPYEEVKEKIFLAQEPEQERSLSHER